MDNNGSNSRNKDLKSTKFILQGNKLFNEIEDDDDNKTQVTCVQATEKVEKKSKDGYLVIMYPSTIGLGRRVIIPQFSDIFVGRHPDCALQINDDSVSRKHAQIINMDASFIIKDLGSTNGTYVNDIPVRGNFELVNGDRIRIGGVLLKFLSGNDYEATYHDAVYKLTIIDALTEAYNKRYLLDFLEREIERSKRNVTPLSLVMIDIDFFKKLNDNYGHLLGDLVLREVSQRIKSTVRKNEIFARYGGEEFTLLLPETNIEGAIGFAERARVLVGGKDFEAESNFIKVTISLGVHCFEPPGDITAEQIIGLADNKLYEAKRSGRNKVCY
jgi:diguanylate cyclase (GGDEF)-like protein